MSKRDDSKQRPALGPEHLARLLELISPDQAEAVRGFTKLCNKLTAFFNMKGISDPKSAADETIDRAMLNIAAGAVVPDVEKYCSGIARNIVLERYRLIQREGLAFQGYRNEMNNSSAESIERIYAVLKPCFEALGVDERELLNAYFRDPQGQPRAEHRRQLAAGMKITVLALRLRVSRLRKVLAECVQQRDLIAQAGM